MATSAGTLRRWDRASYRRIAHVHGRPNGQLTIRFADETTVKVNGRRLAQAGIEDAHWDLAHPGESGLEVVVPARENTPIEIPWDVIRTLTDREFAAYMGAAAQEQARTMGTRLRALRQARGLTARELALRAGITPQSVYRIEHGKHDVVLTTLGKLLAAMGCGFHDLIAASDHDPTSDGMPESQPPSNGAGVAPSAARSANVQEP